MQNIAPTASVSADVKLGSQVQIFHCANLYGCEVGDNSKIGAFVEIQKNVKIGKNCKISSHTFICEGVTIGDKVFVGHNVTFINDKFPRAANESGELKTDKDWQCIPTVVQDGAAIGSSATILCGITIGKGSLVGAGSVVTRDIPVHTVVAGNPAKIIRRLK